MRGWKKSAVNIPCGRLVSLAAMKNRILATIAALGLAFSTVSCMTTYDAYGRPVQSVDPGLAVAGIAAAGLIGYAIADNNNNRNYYNHNHKRGHHNSYRGRGHYGSYSGCSSGYGYYPGW